MLQTTWRSGWPSLAPVAAPIPQPRPAPEVASQVFSSSRWPVEKNWFEPLRFSLTMIAFGSSSVSSTCPSSSAWIGLLPTFAGSSCGCLRAESGLEARIFSRRSSVVSDSTASTRASVASFVFATTARPNGLSPPIAPVFRPIQALCEPSASGPAAAVPPMSLTPMRSTKSRSRLL